MIKLIGYAEQLEDGRVYAHVAPMLIKNDCLLSDIDDVYNGIMVTGDMVGDVMFYGAGAGKLPTASAVTADMIDSVIHSERRSLISWEKTDENVSAGPDDKKFRYFMRTTDTAENVRKVFGDFEQIKSLVEGETA